MKFTDFLQDVGRPIAYYPKLRNITGSTTATILLCQFVYWRGKEKDPDGWLYKTVDQIEEETGLSYKEQKSARKKLTDRGLIEENYERINHRMKYLVKLDKVNTLWDSENSRTYQREDGDDTNGKMGNLPTGNSLIGTTENTSQTTTENTNNICPFQDFLDLWKEKFPDKPQPENRATKLKKSWLTRIKDKSFQENWREALCNASYSPHLHHDGWFHAEFFLRNDNNWQRVKDFEFDWIDQQKYGYKGSDKARQKAEEIVLTEDDLRMAEEIKKRKAERRKERW